MNKKGMLSNLAIITALAAGSASATVLVQADFNIDRVNGNPGASYLNGPEDTDIRIVSSDSTPADPFGGEGNRSLLMDDTGGVAPDIGWATSGFVTEKKEMTLSLKAYFIKDEPFVNAYSIIQAGKNNVAAKSSLTATEAGVQLTVLSDRITARSGGAFLRLNQVPGVDFAWNSVWDIVIHISPESRTWSASINGVPLTHGASDAFEFRDNPEVDGINFISLTGQSTAKDCRVFWDDVKFEVNP